MSLDYSHSVCPWTGANFGGKGCYEADIFEKMLLSLKEGKIQ